MKRINFCSCDICGVGLGRYELYWRDRKGVQKWIKVRGERMYKWKGKEIFIHYKDFVNNELVWVEKVIKPEKVCWECKQNYE
jgi:hypothetical protein